MFHFVNLLLSKQFPCIGIGIGIELKLGSVLDVCVRCETRTKDTIDWIQAKHVEAGNEACKLNAKGLVDPLRSNCKS